MKKLLTIFFISIVSLALNAQGIQFFEGTFDEAKALAKKQNKLIFMDAYTVWCGPCKKMTKDVFPVKEVGDFFNPNFINMKVDMEKGEGTQIARTYGINAYPTLLFIDGKGEVVKLVKGMRGPEALIQLGKEVLAPNPSMVAQLEAKYAAGDRTTVFLREYIKTKGKFGEDFTEPMQTFINKLSPTEKLEKENAEFLLDYSTDLYSPAFKEVLSNEKHFKTNFSEKFETKLNQLVNVAVNDAVQENDANKMKQATAYLKQAKTSNYAEETRWYEVYFYGKTKQWNNYAKAAEKYIPKYKSKDPKTLKEIAWSYYMHVDNTASLKKAEKWITQAINIENTYENNLTHAYLLYKLQQYSEAEDAVEYAIILAENNERLKENAQILKNEVQIKRGKK
jgi:thioredoxin-related protein